MSFGHSERLSYLIAVLLLAVVAWWVRRSVAKRLKGFYAGRSAAKVSDLLRRDSFYLRAVLLMLGTALLVFAWAKPQWGYRLSKTQGEGANVFVAVDLSRSMLAEDLKPNRLERAKRKILDFLAMQKGARIGLIAFAGDAFVQCPLTEDYQSVKSFLELMDPAQMANQGTSFSKAINVAMDSFKDMKGSDSQALVLMSDGEDNDPDIDAAIARAKSQGIRVYALGFATEGGAPIPDERGGFKTDAAGNVVVSKPQTSLMTKIASETGGKYREATLNDADWRDIFDNGINRDLVKQGYEGGMKRIPTERSFWFVVAGVLLMAGQFFVGLNPKILGWFVIAVVSFSAVDHAQASPQSEGVDAYKKGKFKESREAFRKAEGEDPDDYSASYNRAVNSYSLGDYADAADGFAKASQSPDRQLAQASLFNLGNAEAKRGNYEAADRAYDDAVKVNPQSEQVKKIEENRKFVKENKDKKKEEQQKQDGDQQQQNQTQSAPGEQSPQDQQSAANEQKQDSKQGSQQQNDGKSGDQKNDISKNGDGSSQKDDEKGLDKQSKEAEALEEQKDGKEQMLSKEGKKDGAKKEDDKGEARALSEEEREQIQNAERLLRGSKDYSGAMQNRRMMKTQKQERSAPPGGKDW